MNNITDNFLEDINNIYESEIPQRVFCRVKQLMLNYICVTEAGAKYNSNKIRKYMDFVKPENGIYKIIGFDEKVTLKEAVFLNGLNSHALDYDDGTNAGIIHLGAPIFSLLLNLAQKYKFEEREILKAIIVGYETSFTMAYSIQPEHKMRGYHATGTCGILGATIAACYALKFSKEEIKKAFSIAAVSATGLLKVLDDKSELKPYNVAKTVLLSLTSIQMAKAGFEVNDDVLGGNRGFLSMMVGNPEIKLKKMLYDDTYAVEKAYIKPYAACRYCHPSIEAAINLKKEIVINDIKEINVRTYSLAVMGHDHIDVPNAASAKMSIPYGVAIGLLRGKAGLDEYTDELVKNPDVIALTQKVKVYQDKEFSSKFPNKQCAIVEIYTHDNQYSCQVDFPKGEPENPMTDEEFRNHFFDLLKYAEKSENVISQIYDSIMNHELNINGFIDIL